MYNPLFYCFFSFYYHLPFLDLENKLFSVTSGKNVEDELKRSQENLKEIQDDKGLITGSKYIYNRYINKLKDTPCCPLCQRNFDTRDEANDLVTDVSNVGVIKLRKNLVLK